MKNLSKRNLEIWKFGNLEIWKFVALIFFFNALPSTNFAQSSTISWSLISASNSYKGSAYNGGVPATAGFITIGGIKNSVSYNTIIQPSSGAKLWIDGVTYINSSLTVNGKILAEEFQIVTNVDQPDYVFENTYKLRSLSEVEQFINVNKHLPDVPSAAEAKQNGYKIAEMDNTLLRKVEELTLYTIELNKQVEALKAELAKVKGGE